MIQSDIADAELNFAIGWWGRGFALAQRQFAVSQQLQCAHLLLEP
jgi:hypothetical protein